MKSFLNFPPNPSNFITTLLTPVLHKLIFIVLPLGVNIRKSGRGAIVTAKKLGLEVNFDGVYNVYIRVTSKFRGKTEGICGNNNGNPNDLIKRNKRRARNDQEFAYSWRAQSSCSKPPPLPNPCRKARKPLALQAKKKCALLRHHPFSACHHKVKVTSGYIQDCEYDVCACEEHPSACVCEEYAAYVTACGYVGVNIQWKHLPKFGHCSKFNSWQCIV